MDHKFHRFGEGALNVINVSAWQEHYRRHALDFYARRSGWRRRGADPSNPTPTAAFPGALEEQDGSHTRSLSLLPAELQGWYNHFDAIGNSFERRREGDGDDDAAPFNRFEQVDSDDEDRRSELLQRLDERGDIDLPTLRTHIEMLVALVAFIQYVNGAAPVPPKVVWPSKPAARATTKRRARRKKRASDQPQVAPAKLPAVPRRKSQSAHPKAAAPAPSPLKRKGSRRRASLPQIPFSQNFALLQELATSAGLEVPQPQP
mmetsp:Transcript_23864/g.75125  ORF Transcript_23864/g.75125 Transcript_23864/m.75125 type:complete len:261 (+) Transcript_23864:2192-2974(+)